MSVELVTLEDRRAVYALLVRLLDWLPPARLSVRRPEAGAVKPGAGSWRRCGRCAGQGRVRGEGAAAKPCRQPHVRRPFAHGCRPCVACEDGWVRVESLGGRDRMLDVVRDELATAAHERAERRRWVDAQLAKLRAIERQRRGVEAADDELTRAHAAREALFRSGSFRQLELALELLAMRAPLRFEALRLYVIEGQLQGPNPDVQRRLDEAVDWLAARMPRPIRLPADAAAEVAAWRRSLEHGRSEAHRRLREARDREIVGLVRVQGWSLRRVGRLYGLSHERVRKIVEAAGDEAA